MEGFEPSAEVASKAVRYAAHLNEMVGVKGFEPLTRSPELRVIPISPHPIKNLEPAAGIESASPEYETGILPLNYAGIGGSGRDRTRSSTLKRRASYLQNYRPMEPLGGIEPPPSALPRPRSPI